MYNDMMARVEKISGNIRELESKRYVLYFIFISHDFLHGFVVPLTVAG